MTDDRGQILLLSALAACACIVALVVCLHSVNMSYSADGPALTRETLDNVIWVQDAAFAQAAGEAGRCPWDQQASLARDFRSMAGLPVSGIEKSLLARGIAYSFSFNESLAIDYLDDGTMPDTECVAGVLVKRENDNASVCGCAYDMSLSDGSSRYCISTVKTWT
ncbi:MAG: hypothetical protein A4E28_01451 [Methanocella sp. PtaU1.Bin125]|nr:MAG: hypothetical protein A4E28_01451 [Methanocella sp. PtaU1.Bin125]